MRFRKTKASLFVCQKHADQNSDSTANIINVYNSSTVKKIVTSNIVENHTTHCACVCKSYKKTSRNINISDEYMVDKITRN